MGGQQGQKSNKIVGARNRQTQFFHQRLQILFRRLLAMKTELVVKGITSETELYGEPVIGLGLLHPLRRQPFHKAPFPW